MRSCASFRSFCFNSKIVYGALGALSKSRPQTSTINPEEKDRVFLSSINDNRKFCNLFLGELVRLVAPI
ncbi:hypothetical protein PGTUg99_026857 [Puccinia graminis f. sp. tritici]|uniref:Uncharacterized protein n=1 Tax=Puccinia graminis f. sp. tritici TaxID=56615 RepID=A0A5B0S503_PUCGR|nr:hypothetical protein PGTUg99_026857 [Puccinia graminis f. sp. tritici]